MKSLLIIGNLKANPGTQKDMLAYIQSFAKKKLSKTPPINLALPFPFIGIAHNFGKKLPKFITLGAQNITSLEEGAHTGGITPKMLKSCGATFSIIGHSEVRAQGETDSIIAEKAAAAVNSGLIAVICVGEHQRDERGTYLETIAQQVKEALSLLKKEQFSKAVIAYEPIWAVGGTVSATEKECFEVAIMIRRTLAAMVGIDIAKKVRILYGGTVTEKNAKTFIEAGGVDGILVGRASWKGDTFIKLIRACYDNNA